MNADSLAGKTGDILSHNVFTYCVNNPVNMEDPSGHLPFLVVTAIVGAVVGAVAGGIIAAKTGKNVWAGIGIGAVAGALIGSGVGAVAGLKLGGGVFASTAAVSAGAKAAVAGTAAKGGGAVANQIATKANNAAPVVGNPHGSIQHQVAIVNKASQMAQSGNYSTVYVNKALNTAGLQGVQRPDIIGIGKSGISSHVVEVRSISQFVGTHARLLENKVDLILLNNPGVTAEIIFP